MLDLGVSSYQLDERERGFSYLGDNELDMRMDKTQELTAKKIVNTFGEETIHIFQYEPEKLASIKGINKEKALIMAEDFNENWELWQIVGYLERFGIGPQNAKKIYQSLGANAIQEIEDNPYILVDLARGVDFKQIDKMAMDIGIGYDNEKRIESGIKYSLIRIRI